MNIVTILMLLVCANGHGQKAPIGEPVLYKKLGIPKELLTTSVDEDGKMQTFGGDVRIGDLDNDGIIDFLVFRNIDGTKPVFLGAFDISGEVLWKVGEGGGQPIRPGPAAIYDIDGIIVSPPTYARTSAKSWFCTTRGIGGSTFIHHPH
ncbi:MAG: hypothetical protein JXM79_22245 [Sedimentisphaerales bacterium]|nr:hypothetical protein [Sedimentisphaerales bacterium]